MVEKHEKNRALVGGLALITPGVGIQIWNALGRQWGSDKGLSQAARNEEDMGGFLLEVWYLPE